MRLAPGLHRIGSDVVNSYLVEDAAGLTIVDAGLPGHWRELDQELTQLGYSLDDVRGIVLTHGDTDHIGFAERLRQANGIVVHVHELDAARARGEIKKPNSGWGHIKLRPLLKFLWYSGRHGGLRIPPVGEVTTFADGAVLDLPGSPRIIHVPGHTPGSVAVHVPVVDALFVGDAMTTGNVLTGERRAPARALYARPGGCVGIARETGGHTGHLGAARPRGAVARRRSRSNPAGAPGGCS